MSLPVFTLMNKEGWNRFHESAVKDVLRGDLAAPHKASGFVHAAYVRKLGGQGVVAEWSS